MEQFSGDKKEPIQSITAGLERKLIDALLPKFPLWLKGRYLTYMSIPLSIGMILLGYFAQFNIEWLWASNVLIIIHWFTDSFDGAIGKFRKEGVPRWGFYMDHFMDYVFLTSIMVGYSFLLEGQHKELLLFMIPVTNGFMITSFLQYGATQKFDIAFFGIGPTDMRIFCIILNLIIIYAGIVFITPVLSYALLFLILVLIITVYKTQKNIRAIDDQFPDV